MEDIQPVAAASMSSDNVKGGEAREEIGHGFCAICLDKILLQDTALVKGCEHAYCVTCILRWATYKKEPLCPQCKNPFEFLNVHRSLDGHVHDYMFEESVCLLLRAAWFIPLDFKEKEHPNEEGDENFPYECEYDELSDDDDDEFEEAYYMNSSSTSIRIGNRRWGDGGYVRTGRKVASPVVNRQFADGSCAGSSSKGSKKKEKEVDSGVGSSSRGSKNKEKEAAKDITGRRAKRALKREAADKAAAAKHQQHLQRFGRKGPLDAALSK